MPRCKSRHHTKQPTEISLKKHVYLDLLAGLDECVDHDDKLLSFLGPYNMLRFSVDLSETGLSAGARAPSCLVGELNSCSRTVPGILSEALVLS